MLQIGKGITYGVVVIALSVLFISIIVAALLALTPVKELDMTKWLNGSMFAVVLTGAIVGGAVSKKKGLLVGAFIGLIMTALSFLLTTQGAIWTSSLIQTSLTLFISIVGGIAGVNLFGGAREQS
ncbi:TIGR04086 family membrane protein [Jeotgalibacillus proteolyticus]|uniref:TIGR04086 family membrane protein n=1 Tax=Jeotgalibacillus proteolyticus TaxID=2082395 RepID=A0A2S5GEP9_9BACL|nr:TIGR04086 family membrane protein [Jeotgalibacillus proteolyticus]PPA71522.1 TIGR04086 family membrane protein [Jeotgalibacillus proteolyticus]